MEVVAKSEHGVLISIEPEEVDAVVCIIGRIMRDKLTNLINLMTPQELMLNPEILSDAAKLGAEKEMY